MGVLALLVALVLPVLVQQKAQARQAQCLGNLKQITRAVLVYSDDYQGRLPLLESSPAPGMWWWYKEAVKGYAGLSGQSSPRDKLFACPDDRGYTDPGPFCSSAKYDYGSYVFNGVNLPGLPNVAGRSVATVRDPAKTLLMMEWTAHAPLSWHKSRTGSKNQPFYNDAESLVGFVDGHVKLIKIYYDGINAAYTRDPIPGYEYKYSGD
jgi:type II secretory pathway pseudopilin PulG